MDTNTLRQQLTDVLGHTVSAIRIVRESPACVSVLDVVHSLREGNKPWQARSAFMELLKAYPEFATRCRSMTFKGSGQRSTPVLDTRSIIKLIMVLPSKYSDLIRRRVAEVVSENMGGHPNIVAEVFGTRGRQCARVGPEAALLHLRWCQAVSSSSSPAFWARGSCSSGSPTTCPLALASWTSWRLSKAFPSATLMQWFGASHVFTPIWRAGGAQCTSVVRARG